MLKKQKKTKTFTITSRIGHKQELKATGKCTKWPNLIAVISSMVIINLREITTFALLKTQHLCIH